MSLLRPGVIKQHKTEPATSLCACTHETDRWCRVPEAIDAVYM